MIEEVNKKRSWLWVLLFIFVALLLSALATGWNIVLVRDYQKFVELAKNISLQEISVLPSNLIINMILGTLGFVATLGLTILIFIKLLKEMRLNQLQSEFLATVSHELKTPLASIELSSGLIRSGGLSEAEINALWNSHQNELHRLKEEVEALLEAARWQGKPSFKKRAPLLLENWLIESFTHWKQILGPTSILIREGEPLPIEIDLDLRTLNLIVNNLINNAKKFSKGAPHVVIRTTYFPSNGGFSKPRWKIQFQDQGWGFNPADSKKIFHRFFRSTTSAPYAIPGTGLGLYLARSASRAMGLSLSAESLGTGKGAVFILEGKVP